MMLVALLLLTVGFQLASPDDTASGDGVSLADGWPPVVVSALVLYVCGYQIGFGPIAWLIISEIFPIKTRTRALSLAVIVNFGFNLLVTFLLAPLQNLMDSVSPGKGARQRRLLPGPPLDSAPAPPFGSAPTPAPSRHNHRRYHLSS